MFFLLILHIQSVVSSLASCSVLMNTLEEQQQSPGGGMAVFLESIPYLVLSGGGAQQYGDYDSCLRQLRKYSVMVSYTNLGRNAFGFCHSPECEAADFNQPSIQVSMKKIVKGYGLDQLLQINLDEAVLVFSDPEKNNHPPIGVGFIFTIIIFAIIIILSISLPFLQILFNFQTRNERYKILYGQIQEVNEQTSLIKQRETSTIKFLKIFSILENYKQFINLSTPDSNLTIFNGFRAIAFMMVVFGHQFFLTSIVTYQLEMLISFQTWVILILFNMLYSVDIFFWIGGFFLGFVVVDQKKSQSLRKSPFIGSLLMILHRVLRIWPSYIIIIILSWNIAPYLGDGPRWYQTQYFFDCSTWYRNLFFYSTFFEDSGCVPWGWYLSNDMQLFFISLIPLVIYIKIQPNIGKGLIWLLLLFTQSYGIWLCFKDNYLISFNNSGSTTFQYDYYQKPWCRGPPYFIGLLLGIFYREYKGSKSIEGEFTILKWLQQKSTNLKGRVLIQFIFYIIGFGLVGIILFGWRPNQLDPYKWSFNFQHWWQGLSRSILVIGLSFLCVPNMIGIQDIFNTQMMNCSFFKVMAKISFTGYLIHYIIEVVTLSNSYQTPNFDTSAIIYALVGNMGLTIISAILMSLMVEMPFGKLEQQFISKLTGSKKKAKSLEGEIDCNPITKPKKGINE